MIKNNKQLGQAKQNLKELSKRLGALGVPADLTEKMQRASYECRIHNVKEEIKEYESLLKKHKLHYTNKNLSKAIISLRIASGYTQKALAEKLGLPEQQIQRYEQQEYAKVKFERIVQIIRVLSSATDMCFEVSKNIVNPFRLSTDSSKVQEARMKLKNNKTIINFDVSA